MTMARVFTSSLNKFFNALLVCALAQAARASGSSPVNVYGDELQSCSQSGMALTGYTRTGYCVDVNGDSGSHHICIDLSSATGGNFCDVTGQSDWCSSSMTCHDTQYDENAGDDDGNYCQVQNWCVCQWAFASYIENAGGCDQIQDVVCDSINMQAVRAYQSMAGKMKYDNALACIESRCGISVARFTARSFFVGGAMSKAFNWVAGTVLVVGSVLAFFVWNRRQQHQTLQQHQGKGEHLVDTSDAAEDPASY